MFESTIVRGLIWAAAGCGFTWLMTTAGSAVVLFTGKDPERGKLTHHIFLGFAAGVMIAASVWSLLNPAIEQAEELGQVGWIPAAGGFLLGVAFLIVLDTLLPHLHAGSAEPEGLECDWKRTTLLVSAVTLHNIPEGMSVGLLFAMASQTAGAAGDAYLGMAVALATGIGLQNFPEGAAVSLPLRREGASRLKAFAMGSRGRHDLRSGRGAHPRGAFGRAFQCGYPRRHRGIRDHDGARRGAGLRQPLPLPATSAPAHPALRCRRPGRAGASGAEHLR